MTTPIIVGVDGSDGSKRALAWAIDEARLRNAPLRAVICEPAYAEVHAFGAGSGVHAMDALDLATMRDRVVRIVDELQLAGATTAGLDVRVEGHAGAPVGHFMTLSDSAQLLVVGARGHGPMSHLGHASVVTAMTRHATCPVAVIP